MSTTPFSVLTTQKLHSQTDKISFIGPCHLPKIFGQNDKSNHWGDSLRTTKNTAGEKVDIDVLCEQGFIPISFG